MEPGYSLDQAEIKKLAFWVNQSSYFSELLDKPINHNNFIHITLKTGLKMFIYILNIHS